MEVGLISDTHSHIDDRILHHLSDVDIILHAGDLGDLSIIEKLESIAEVKGVYGNIDDASIRKQWPEHQLLMLNGAKLLMIHIAGAMGRYNTKTRDLIKLHAPDVLICGHSHILKIAFDSKFGLLHMNPGAAGRHGFHKQRTMLRFKIMHGKIEQLRVIELGPRSAKPID